MRTPHINIGRQRGATAVIAAIVIVLLAGIIGFVIDLGVLYVRKTELQNSADAAALAGAKELTGTVPGINAAVAAAIDLAQANRSDFTQTPVTITASNISFAASPFPPGDVWLPVADAIKPENVHKMWFIKVDTTGIAQGTRPTTPFIRVLNENLESTTATGLAVAGPTQCEGLPIFTCIPSPDPAAANCDPSDPSATCGFEKGRSYVFNDQWKPTNPIGPGNVGWLDPVPFGSGKLINGTNELRDFLCRGRSMCLAAPVTYTSITQAAFNPTADALNTRFGIFEGTLNKDEYRLGEFDKDGNQIKAACAVDTNIKEFRYEDTNTATHGCKGGQPGCPAEWMVSDPDGQSTQTGATVGVSWTAIDPTATANAGEVENYPSGTPYGQTTGIYYDDPPSGVVTATGRRILTVGLASNCPDITGAGKPVKIEAFGQFLMQRQAFDTGGQKGFFGEFIRLIPAGAGIRPEIKLYR